MDTTSEVALLHCTCAEIGRCGLWLGGWFIYPSYQDVVAAIHKPFLLKPLVHPCLNTAPHFIICNHNPYVLDENLRLWRIKNSVEFEPSWEPILQLDHIPCHLDDGVTHYIAYSTQRGVLLWDCESDVPISLTLPHELGDPLPIRFRNAVNTVKRADLFLPLGTRSYARIARITQTEEGSWNTDIVWQGESLSAAVAAKDLIAVAQENGHVSVIDEQGEIIKTFQINARPAAVLFLGNHLYIAAQKGGNNVVHQICLETDRVLTSFFFGSDSKDEAKISALTPTEDGNLLIAGYFSKVYSEKHGISCSRCNNAIVYFPNEEMITSLEEYIWRSLFPAHLHHR